MLGAGSWEKTQRRAQELGQLSSPDRKILFHGGKVWFDHEARVLDVLVENGRFVEIAPIINTIDAVVIDATDRVLLPGFVDGHRHIWQTNLRGLLGNHVLADYYRMVRMGYANAFTPDDVYLSVYAGALDALRDGVTTVLDHSHIMNSPEHADAAVAALRASGLRAIFCYGFYAAPTKNPAFSEPGARFRDIARVRRDLLPSDDGLVTMGSALTEHWICPLEVTREEIRVSRELGLKNITLHVGPAPGTTDIDRFRCTECFGPEFTFSHCNCCQQEFFEFVARQGGAIVTTPETELGMGMGRPAIGRAIEAGISLGLGIDVISYAGGDLFTAARLALATARADGCQAVLDRGKMPNKVAYTTADAFHWMTAGGARAIGMDRTIGSIELGKRADLILLRTDSLNMAPMRDAATSVVLHARSTDIDCVFVDGRPRILENTLVGIDPGPLVAKLTNSQTAILERLESSRDENSATVRAYERILAEKQQ